MYKTLLKYLKKYHVDIYGTVWYRKEIKKYLRYDIKKESNKDKKEKLYNLLFKL